MSVQGHHCVRNTETGKDLVPADAASNRGTYQAYYYVNQVQGSQHSGKDCGPWGPASSRG